MHPQTHRGHSRWRRFWRNNRNLAFVAFFLFVILGVVAVLFYFITSPNFVKPH